MVLLMLKHCAVNLKHVKTYFKTTGVNASVID